ncbi:MAG: zinc ribbon domain-containing protein [Alistipes sp.]|nr:zinc ribbon domain-containing protein [Alistipes sp.]
MRCNNCGWTNPVGVSKCQKCNQPLTGTETAVYKESAEVPSGEVVSVKCEKCGYPVSGDWSMCPNCGAQVGNIPLKDEPSKKVEDDSRKTLVLDQLPISEENEDMKNMDSSSTPQTLSKATVIANPHGMVAAEKKKTNELNKTVLESASHNPSKDDTRKTVVDTADYAPTISKHAAASKSDKKDYSYSLSCMDGNSSIELKSSSELAVKEGDVVLIGGLRYRVG